MTDFTSAVVGRLARLVLFREWSVQIEAHALTAAGLSAIRDRLTFGGEFEPGPDLDLLRLRVSDELAIALGLNPADMPDTPQVPDSLPDEWPTGPE